MTPFSRPKILNLTPRVLTSAVIQMVLFHILTAAVSTDDTGAILVNSVETEFGTEFDNNSNIISGPSMPLFSQNGSNPNVSSPSTQNWLTVDNVSDPVQLGSVTKNDVSHHRQHRRHRQWRHPVTNFPVQIHESNVHDVVPDGGRHGNEDKGRMDRKGGPMTIYSLVKGKGKLLGLGMDDWVVWVVIPLIICLMAFFTLGIVQQLILPPPPEQPYRMDEPYDQYLQLKW